MKHKNGGCPTWFVLGVLLWGSSFATAEPLVRYDLAYVPSASTAADEAAVPDHYRCDLYLPAGQADEATAGQESLPVVLVLHGGAWRSGDKWVVGRYGKEFAEAGFAAVVINYRHAPKHRFPAQIDDVRLALLWIADHAEQYNFDPQRIGLFGYSAGAHMAALIGTLSDEPLTVRQATSQWPEGDPRWERLPKPKAIVAGGTPCDFRDLPPNNDTLAYFLGGPRSKVPEWYRLASPAEHVSANDPPTLYFHGRSDAIVPWRSARRMFSKQSATGACVEYLTLERQGHLTTFLHPASGRAAVGFFAAYLRDRSASPANR